MYEILNKFLHTCVGNKERGHNSKQNICSNAREKNFLQIGLVGVMFCLDIGNFSRCSLLVLIPAGGQKEKNFRPHAGLVGE